MSNDPSVTSGLVRDFVAQKRLALAGASRSGRKFGMVILLLMFRPGVHGFHELHRGLWSLLGKLPAEAARA